MIAFSRDFVVLVWYPASVTVTKLSPMVAIWLPWRYTREWPDSRSKVTSVFASFQFLESLMALFIWISMLRMFGMNVEQLVKDLSPSVNLTKYQAQWKSQWSQMITVKSSKGWPTPGVCKRYTPQKVNQPYQSKSKMAHKAHRLLWSNSVVEAKVFNFEKGTPHLGTYTGRPWVCVVKETRRRCKRKASRTAYLYPIVIPIRDTEPAYSIRLDCPTRLLLRYWSVSSELT